MLPDGRTQLFIATMYLHEVTSPQAFAMLRELGLPVLHPERLFATVDHIIPTDNQCEPFADPRAAAMLNELRRNCQENNIRFFDLPSGRQGIVHMVGPELGITQPGMTIVCGDSHTATHGAVGSIAMGIGTTQVRDVLATQTLAMSPLKVLTRGYAMAQTEDGQVLRSTKQVQTGDRITVTLSDGKLSATVSGKENAT